MAVAATQVRVEVPSEYDRLEVVVMCLANPYPADADLPEPDEAFEHQVRRFYFGAYDVELVQSQQRALIGVLEGHGVDVLLAEPRWLISQHYTRDIGFAVDDVFVIGRPRRDFRQQELVGLRPIVERLSKVAHLDCGSIEGGDVMLAEGVVMVGLGEETSRAGIEALEYRLSLLGSRRRVVPLEFAQRGAIHLDCELNVIAPGLALVHRPSFRRESLRWIEDHFEIIETTAEEMRECRLNVLAVRPGLVVVERGSDRIAAELERRGIETIGLEYTEVNRLPGSFRCTTLPLRRSAPSAPEGVGASRPAA